MFRLFLGFIIYASGMGQDASAYTVVSSHDKTTVIVEESLLAKRDILSCNKPHKFENEGKFNSKKHTFEDAKGEQLRLEFFNLNANQQEGFEALSQIISIN